MLFPFLLTIAIFLLFVANLYLLNCKRKEVDNHFEDKEAKGVKGGGCYIRQLGAGGGGYLRMS